MLSFQLSEKFSLLLWTLSASSYQLPEYFHSLLTTHNSQLTTHVSQLTTHNSRLTIHDSRLTSHVSRFTSHDSRLVPQRFIIFQHVLDPFHRFLLSTEGEESLALKIQQVLFVDELSSCQIPTTHYPGKFVDDFNIMC